MVTTDAHDESQSSRRRWLRRASAAAIATAVLGIGGTGLSVAVVSARQAESGSTGTKASSNSDDTAASSSSSDDSSSSSSGLGSTTSDSTSQGGSNGS